MPKKIVTVLGARPQFIKASVVSRAIRQSSNLVEKVLHTGQHFDANMSNVFFNELDIPAPAYQLEIHGGPHGEMTGRMLIEIERILIQEKPDAVLVYGDTNSTLAGALAASKMHIPLAHVEAGLRSFNMQMPEEINRILTDRVSEWLFTPTQTAQRHLEAEGIHPEKIIPVGDVMYDVALFERARAPAESSILATYGLTDKDYVLTTVHRAENTNHPQRLQRIIAALEKVAQSVPVVWPVHPRMRSLIESNSSMRRLHSNIHLLEPIGYLDMVLLEKAAAVIATDSGGVQKEAFFHGVPCVTLRDETEWVELIQAGWNRLAPPCSELCIADSILQSIGTKGESVHPYGLGDASVKIVRRLAADLGA